MVLDTPFSRVGPFTYLTCCFWRQYLLWVCFFLLSHIPNLGYLASIQSYAQLQSLRRLHSCTMQQGHNTWALAHLPGTVF